MEGAQKTAPYSNGIFFLFLKKGVSLMRYIYVFLSERKETVESLKCRVIALGLFSVCFLYKYLFFKPQLYYGTLHWNQIQRHCSEDELNTAVVWHQELSEVLQLESGGITICCAFAVTA